MIVILVTLFSITMCSNPFSETNLIVQTNEGPVQGYYDTPNGKSIRFSGIPYAETPTSRFEPPQSPSDRNNVLYDAKEFASPCLQKDLSNNGVLIGSADCLYLNIWIPGGLKNGRVFRTPLVKRKPVIVAFHDGFQAYGSGNDSNIVGNMAAHDGDIIWVTMNYRLGIWGFMAHSGLSIQQGGFSGAYGTLDQIQALKWVKANIARFGGDPGQIGLYGVGGGAEAVSTILSYEKMRGFYKFALIESPYLLWQQTLSDVENKYQLLINQNLNCSGYPNTVMCVKGVSNEELSDAIYPSLPQPYYSSGDPFEPSNFFDHIFTAPAGSITTKSTLQTIRDCPEAQDTILFIGHSMNESEWYSNSILPRSPVLNTITVEPMIREFLKRLFPIMTGNTIALNNAVNFVVTSYGSDWKRIVSDAQYVCSTYALLNSTSLGNFNRLYHYVIDSKSSMTERTNHHGSGNPYWTKIFELNRFNNVTLPDQKDYFIAFQLKNWLMAALKNDDPNKAILNGPDQFTGWPKWDRDDERYAHVEDYPILHSSHPTSFENCRNIWFKAYQNSNGNPL